LLLRISEINPKRGTVFLGRKNAQEYTTITGINLIALTEPCSLLVNFASKEVVWLLFGEQIPLHLTQYKKIGHMGRVFFN